MNEFLLYGANGYTGELIARLSASYGLKPILAGRNQIKLEALANELALSYRVFGLEETKKLEAALLETTLVVNAAGPFIHTLKPMIEACLKTKRHYLDINGDISCFEQIKTYNEAAKEQGIMLMPGVGFDVVPTDCLSLFLKDKMPDAKTLKIAFATPGGSISHGTAMTMTSKLGKGGMIRQNGKIVKRPLGEKGMTVNFGLKEIFVMSIPWGDVSTAFHTTGIPNIETFTAVPKKVYNLLKFQSIFNWLLRTNMVRDYLRKKINQRPPGPDEASRSIAKSLVWAEVSDEKGDKKTASLEGPEGYTITAHATLIITKYVLNGSYKTGYQTPAGCYGADLILDVPDLHRKCQLDIR
jgi:short subunit dehydrogenase-like uncharacterized protein